jgi:predicted transcriptional regulator
MREDVKRQRDEAEYDARFRRQAQAGLDSANAGTLIPAEDVEAAFAARRAQTRYSLNESTP